MKWLMLLMLLFVISAPMNGEVLKGGISYTVETARVESFRDIPTKIDMSLYKNHFKDPNYEKNKKAILKDKMYLKGRSLTVFSNDTYALWYYKQKEVGYYYDEQGNLKYIDILYNSDYPKRGVMYSLQGNLDSIYFTVSPNEQFVFSKDKKLVAHWIGDNCYNEQGELILTRE